MTAGNLHDLGAGLTYQGVQITDLILVLDMSGQVTYMILGLDTSGLQVTYVIQVANEGVDVFDGTGAQVERTVRPGQRSCTQSHNGR